jgi:hypothetical protein
LVAAPPFDDVGLKNIHLLFISMAVALCLGFGSWCVWRFREAGGAGMLAAAAVSFASAVGLTVYGNWFVKKMKGISS